MATKVSARWRQEQTGADSVRGASTFT